MAFLDEDCETTIREHLNKHLVLRVEFNIYERDESQQWPEDVPKIDPVLSIWDLDEDRPKRIRVMRTTETRDRYWSIYSDDASLCRCYCGKLRGPVALTLAQFGYYRRPVCVTYERGRRSVGAGISLDTAFSRKGVGQ